MLLPGVAKAVVVGRGLGVLAKRAVGVDGGAAARCIGRGDDAAQVVGIQPALGCGARAFVPDQRFIHPGAMHVAALDCTRAGIVLSHQVHPVVQQLAGFVVTGSTPDVDLGLTQSALGIVGQAGVDSGGQVGGDRCFKAVVTVIAVLPVAGRRQVAVGIVGRWEVGLADACDAGVLVQAVGGVAVQLIDLPKLPQ